ncbi:Retrovirus-related Pol polyprotein from transposon 297 [Vitis vinifera]|uniref:Retrovirus-related Pol polyprotein from transposon 297 n=1 Tax=Vitis vinifera TaxID=29760 RepID=A0A438C6G1_VITVI|nr:Retrovirus-related Pol polyprotein from transposon 297 [Vitis vinifera]
MSCCDIFISDQSSRELFNGSSQEVRKQSQFVNFKEDWNPHLQEVVQAEVLKLLQAGIIYPISDNPWVSPTQVVPKKSGITVVQNEKGEEITTTPHFRLEGYFQIEIDVADQEKTTFTCPFGTYAYRRMPFGLCNAPTTFQRCMLSIFSDMVERIMEVFMDDITVCGGIEVDKAKVELIVKLPSPTTVKGELCLAKGKMGSPMRFTMASKTLNEAQRNYTTTEKELLAVVFALDKFCAYLVGSFIIVFTDHSALKYLLTKQDAKASEWNARTGSNCFAKIHAYYWEEPFLFKYCADQIIRKCVPEDEQQGILSHCHENACGGTLPLRKQL